MRKTALDMVHWLARRDKRVVFIGSDLRAGLLADMKKEFPQRFFMEGIMEQYLVGMAAGMAMDGLIPYLNTIATFFTRRAYEQIAVDLCMHNLPVRLIASGGGLVYAPLGPTHLAIEDISIMRALPNMTVVAPCDAREMVRMMDASLTWPGPMYIRLAKGGEKIISKNETAFVIGEAVPMKVVRRPDVVLMTTGTMTTHALEAASHARARPLTSVIHFPTIKPLDELAVLRYSRGAALVVTIEEGISSGGFGSAVTDVLVNDNFPGRIKRIALPDAFSKHYGTQQDLFEVYGLTPHQIAETVRALY